MKQHSMMLPSCLTLKWQSSLMTKAHCLFSMSELCTHYKTHWRHTSPHKKFWALQFAGSCNSVKEKLQWPEFCEGENVLQLRFKGAVCTQPTSVPRLQGLPLWALYFPKLGSYFIFCRKYYFFSLTGKAEHDVPFGAVQAQYCCLWASAGFAEC